MERNHQPIGVFDSGMGGMTVLRALREALPQESFIYLGDTARLPYGTKSQETVKAYAVQMAKLLVEREIKALVIACNTATTAALSHLQTILPDMPVLGVVAPGAEAAVAATSNRRVMVLATETTIASGAYQTIIHNHLPEAKIQTRACSVLVALAEEGMIDNSVAEAALRHYLQGLTGEDTLLLGCTHFPVFKKALKRILPAEIKIVDSAEATARALKQTLGQAGLLNGTASVRMHYLTTDSVHRFSQVGALFLGEILPADQVELVDGCPK